MTGWRVVAPSLGCLRPQAHTASVIGPRSHSSYFLTRTQFRGRAGCPGFLTTHHLWGVVGAGSRTGPLRAACADRGGSEEPALSTSRVHLYPGFLEVDLNS